MTLAPTKPDHARDVALLKAIGLDRLAPEQRELALNIANRYELDLLLKHLVMIEGRPFITRDGLLHIAHRSGQLDGIETTDPVLVDGFWRASCSVWRKDMSRAFTYAGRYPETGKNRAYAPEMAVKVAESMALRRAFDVAAPSADERWDVDAAPLPAEPKATLAEKIAERKAGIVSPPRIVASGDEQGHDDEPPDLGEAPVAKRPKPKTPTPVAYAPAEDDPTPEPIPVAPGQVGLGEAVATMTGEEFKAVLAANRIAPQYAFAEAQVAWPEVKAWTDLNGEQLAELADFLTSTKE